MRGKPERDMVSLRMMGWGLVVVESSSAAVVVAAVAVAVHPKSRFWVNIYERCRNLRNSLQNY